jgi:hypothetical protein
VTRAAKLTTVAEFPAGCLLENIVVRPDGSILVTEFLHMQVWHLPRQSGPMRVAPTLVHTFDQLASGIVEVDSDIFYVSTTNGLTTGESYLHRLDLRDWNPGAEASVETVLAWEGVISGLNGSCLLAPGTVLLADSLGGLIWQVDLSRGGAAPTRRVWLADETMEQDPNSTMVPPQPGVNGVRYAVGTSHVYYTSTSKGLFMRVAVDQASGEPAGRPEVIAKGIMGDDFCLDEAGGAAYVTTHRENTIARVPMRPGADRDVQIVAGDPFDELLAGPSSCAWGRDRGDVGRVAYLTTDGGLVAPHDGVVRPARVLRVELAEAAVT